MQSSKSQIFELPANSEKIVTYCLIAIKQYDLRGLNLFQTIKSFLLLFLEKEDNPLLCNFPINQNLKIQIQNKLRIQLSLRNGGKDK